MNIRIFLLCALFLLPIGTVFSQEPSDSTKKELKLITKNDGTEYIGAILSDDGREILIETKRLGKIYIPKSEIRSIQDIHDEDVNDFVQTKDGVYDPAGPFTTRYYFTNNALPTAKGDSYSMIHLYGPELHFGVGKGFSAGIMTSWGASPFILALKQSIKTKNEKLNFSLGTMMGSSGYFNTFRGWGGMHWATMTYGSTKNNLSLSGGYLYINPGFRIQPAAYQITAAPGFYSDTANTIDDLRNGVDFFKTPMFSIAGIAKIGKRVSFIFDSMFSLRIGKSITWTTNATGAGYQVSANQAKIMFFLMPGMRFQKSSRNAFQIALAGVTAINVGNSIYSSGRTVAFPVPMCSWFFKI